VARRDEILEVIKDHKRKSKGDGPSYRTLLGDLHKRKYEMCLTTLRRHIKELEHEGKLEDTKKTGGRLILPKSVWLPEDDDEPAPLKKPG
jgi:hypothetical protein